MTLDPYRSAPLRCPACKDVALRLHAGRLLCDACKGIFLSFADLARALDELTSAASELVFIDERAGERRCPQCTAPMTACRLRVEFPAHEQTRVLKPALDRCAADGVWFDDAELARVFEDSYRVITHRGFGNPLVILEE